MQYFSADRTFVTYETLETDGPVIPSTVDRRRSIREPRVVPAWLSDASGSGVASSQQQVTVIDLSLHGVGFRANKRLAKDDEHWIVIATDRLHLSTRLRVVSVRECAEGGYEIGAEFF